MRCARRFPSKSSTPEKAAQTIHDLMAPVLSEGSDWSANVRSDGIQKLLEQLCRNAYEFVLLTRCSKATYYCKRPKVDSALVKEDAEPQAYEGPKGGEADEEVGKVASVLFGVLVKYLEHNRAEQIVLEKAHVVIRRS
jgi:hypothetical protein